MIIFRFWVCGCFVSTVQGRYSFFPAFPLAESMAKAFGWLFLWALRERLCHSIWLFYFILYWKYSLFLQFSRWWAPWLGHFIGYSFGISRNKASTVSYGTAKGKSVNHVLWYGFFYNILKWHFYVFFVGGWHGWAACWPSFWNGSVIACGCFISTARWKDSLFLQFSPWLNP